jgi:hypothetical protein
MPKQTTIARAPATASVEPCPSLAVGRSLWDFDFAELTGHNLESRGRKIVNRLLEDGWRLLHIYTLRYEENGVWRERPMAILGKLRKDSTFPGEEPGNRCAPKSEFSCRVVSLTNAGDGRHCREVRRP